VRFGGMKMRFGATGAANPAEPDAKGTRAIASVERPRKPAASPAPAPVAPEKGGVPAAVWLILMLVVAVAAFFVLKGRA
jgi:hypothetical protein